MIKLFRKVRQNLLTENKFSKYLLYATGEIVLVVIGILIALTLNNNNAKEKSETKALVILDELLEELSSNIYSIKEAGLIYEKKDSLSYLVLNTKLTKEDYQNDFVAFYQLTGTNYVIDLSNNSYSKLLQMTEAIPTEFSEVMKELFKLNQSMIYVHLMGNNVYNLVDDINKYNIYHYPWSININRQEMVDYFYSDNRYKSDVKLILVNGVDEHYELAFNYMQRAIKCYKEIATLRNKSIDHTLLGYDPEISKILIGSWVSERLPGYISNIYVEDGRLLHKNNANSDIGEYYALSKTKLISSNNVGFLTISKEENETIVYSRGGLVWKKTKG